MGRRGIKERTPSNSESGSHEQRIRNRIGTWDSGDSIISPPRDVLHVRASNELITSNGTPSTSNAGAPLASNDTLSYVASGRVPTGETATDSTEGAANRARSATAARWGELASRAVVPLRRGLVIYLSGELSQNMGGQLSTCVGLRKIIAKLGWMVVIVDQGRILIRGRGIVVGNDRAASGGMVRLYSMRVLTPVKKLGNGWVGLGTA